MTGSRPIVSDRPVREVWKLLRLFLDTSSVVTRIRTAHNLAKGTHNSNIRKQAVQVAQSIRQAEEYFRAAEAVTLATRPTLAYYGAVSLARALILLRLDGNYSYDALRAAERHNHHGLDIKKNFVSTEADADASDVFRSIGCQLHVHEGATIPWGNFPLFYRSLMSPGVVVPHTIVDQGAAFSRTQDEVVGGVEFPPVEELMGKQLDLLTLIQQMPDMWLHLIDLDMNPAVCPGKAEISTLRIPEENSTDPPTPERARQEWSFYVFAATQEQKHALKKLVEDTSGMVVTNETGTSLALKLSRELTKGEEEVPVYIPDLMDSLTGRLFFIPQPDTYLVEPASHLATLFCLSMLARYYPDKWMTFIERNVLVSELLDSVLTVIERKLPLLVLDQLTGLKHYVQPQ